MSKNKKKKYPKYPRFFTNRLKNKWPFSLQLAEDLFFLFLNQYDLCSSFRDFFIYTESTEPGIDNEASYYFKEFNEIFGETGIWDISQYPDFFIQNNKVHYNETRKSKVQNSTKEELIIKPYTLDHIPYQTIVCQAARFYIKNFFQGSVANFNPAGLKILSVALIWQPVFKYLLFTKFSSAMKNTLENQNYIKNYEREILRTFYYGLKGLECDERRLERILSKTERSFFEERLLNVFLFSGISETTSKTLVTNFFLTESFDEILAFYQELLSKFKPGIN